LAIPADGLNLTRTAPAQQPKPQAAPKPTIATMAADTFQRVRASFTRHEDVDNNNVQLPLAGANTLPTEFPHVMRLDRMLLAIQSRFPKGFGIADKFMRFGGVAAAGASFVWSSVNLVRTWNRQPTAAKVLNTTSTVATGAGTVAGLAWLRTGSQLASNLMGGFLGVAGTIYQGIRTFNEFRDPTKTAGQRGMSLVSTVLTGAGTVAMFIPGGQIVGLPLIIGGGILGAVGDWVGKLSVVNHACEWVGKKLGPVARGIGHVWHGVFG
jgi:hypothetical protein